MLRCRRSAAYDQQANLTIRLYGRFASRPVSRNTALNVGLDSESQTACKLFEGSVTVSAILPIRLACQTPASIQAMHVRQMRL